MGTRSDFYVKKEKQMEWIASKSFDGYPDGIDKHVLESKTEEEYRENLNFFFTGKDDVTLPEDGWPWPWNDSNTTNYAYIFENGKVMASYYGGILFDPLIKQEEDENEDQEGVKFDFPDMSDVKNVAFGKRSGMTIVQSNPDGTINII